MFKKYVSFLPAIAMLFAGALVQSCSDDDKDNAPAVPEISFEKQTYRLGLGQVAVKVVSNIAPTADIAIPVEFAGGAQEGTNFTVESHEVVIKAGETSAEYVISRALDADGYAVVPENPLELHVNLKTSTGYTLGLLNYATVSVLGKNGDNVSFTSDYGKVAFSSEFTVGVYNMNGWPKKVAQDETFEFEIVSELTTAVEGVHFELPGGHSVKVETNQREGSFTMNMLKAEPEHDTVVLRLLEKEGYGFSNYQTMTIKISGPDYFAGTWAFKEIVNLSLFSDYGEDVDRAPKCSPEDKITFAGDNYQSYTFTPDIKGDFKNYFGTESRTVTYTGEEVRNFQENHGAMVPVLCYSFPDINVKFSPNVTETRAAKVCFRMIQVDGEDILECTLDDWEPAEGEFGYDTYTFMKDMPEGFGWWMPYRIHLTKVQ